MPNSSLSSLSFFTMYGCVMAAAAVGAAHAGGRLEPAALGLTQAVPSLDSEEMWRGRGGAACAAVGGGAGEVRGDGAGCAAAV